MDEFLEVLVQKRPDTKTVIYKALIGAGLLLLTVLIFFLSLVLFQFFFIFILILIGAVYGSYRLMGRLNVEFEYILTNTDLDVDKITARRTRKRLITINLRDMEIMAPADGSHVNDFSGSQVRTVFDASSDREAEGTYFIVGNDSSHGLFKLYFTPDKRIIDAAHLLAPRKVFTD